MDIVTPSLAWVNGSCFRVNQEAEFTVSRGYTGEFEDDHGMADEALDDIESDLRHPIEETASGFKARIEVASTFFSQIIGKGGQTKSRLERDTRTRINIPKKGLEGDIIVQGQDKRGVVTALNRIDAIVMAARNKQPFTHFISLPANTPQMQEAFANFKSQVLESCSDCSGVEESIFQTSTLLHLTVGTMALLDDRERQLAREILQDCKEQIILPLIGENPFKVRIQGLEMMNDDPGEVDVLYGKVIGPGADLMQQAAERIVDRYVEAGLMKREYDRIKFHVTLMNTLFRKDKTDVGDTSEKQPAARESFDSRKIMSQLGDFDFGEVEISEIHLSQRRAGRRTAAGYYLPSTIVTLTTCG